MPQLSNLKINKKIIIIAFTAFLILSFFIWLAYINNYKKPLSEVDYSLKSTTSVTVKETAYNFITYEGDSAKTGLVLYPDKKVDAKAYAPFANLLAQKGVFVIVCNMPFHSSYLPYKRAIKAIKRYPGIKKWYVGGFGKGGLKAQKCLKKYSKYFEGAVLLGSYCKVNFKKSDKKIIAVYGDLDGVIKPKKIKKSEKKYPKNHVTHVIKGGNHSNFGYYKKFRGDKKATITRVDQIMEATSFLAGEL